MAMKMDLTSFDSTLKDVYPLPGTRIKLWVVQMRREQEWERETCPRLEVPEHYDEADDVEVAAGELLRCAGSGITAWNDLSHRDCRFCEGFYFGAMGRADVAAWQAEKAARPPITADHDALSDVIEPDWQLRESPAMAMLRGRSADGRFKP